MRITISVGAANILEKLLAAGFHAYIVGGAVRDSVMGKAAHDYDIATNALPGDVKRIFKRRLTPGLRTGQSRLWKTASATR